MRRRQETASEFDRREGGTDDTERQYFDSYEKKRRNNDRK